MGKLSVRSALPACSRAISRLLTAGARGPPLPVALQARLLREACAQLARSRCRSAGGEGAVRSRGDRWRAAPASSRAARPCLARIERTLSPRTLRAIPSLPSTARIVPLRLSHACAREGWRARVCRIGFAFTPQPNPATASHSSGTLKKLMRSGASGCGSASADAAERADRDFLLAGTSYPTPFSSRYKERAVRESTRTAG